MRTLLMCAALLAACGAEDALSVSFTVQCQPVAEDASVSLVGKIVQFSSYKINYDDFVMVTTFVNLQQAAHLQDGIVMSEFQVGYDLHRLSESNQQERATFGCATAFVDANGVRNTGYVERTVSFGEVQAAFGVLNEGHELVSMSFMVGP